MNRSFLSAHRRDAIASEDSAASLFAEYGRALHLSRLWSVEAERLEGLLPSEALRSGEDNGAAVPKEAASQPGLPSEVRALCKSGGPYFGVFKRVAESLKVSRATVKAVASGRNTSARILAALHAHIAELDVLRGQCAAQPFAPQDLKEFAHGCRYYGMLSNVARQLGISHAALIRQLKRGEKGRPSYLAAVRKAMRVADLQRDVPAPRPLSTVERRNFVIGARYYGVFARTARAMGTTPGAVHNVATGIQKSRRILTALRGEMARIDAEIAIRSAA